MKIIALVLFATGFLSATIVQHKGLSENMKEIESVTISRGNQVVLEKFFKKHHKYNGKDAYKVEFICSKKGRKKVCQVRDYEILTPQRPGIKIN